MGQALHESACTTEAVRRAIQHRQEGLRTLASRHGVNPKTIAKWRKRAPVADRLTGWRRSPLWRKSSLRSSAVSSSALTPSSSHAQKPTSTTD